MKLDHRKHIRHELPLEVDSSASRASKDMLHMPDLLRMFDSY